MVGPLRIEDLQWEQEGAARQRLRVVFAEVAFVEVEGGLAVELEQHGAARARDLAARAEHVPAAGAAGADPDAPPVEADAGHETAARRAIGADERLAEGGPVAGQPSGQGHVRADGVRDPGDELAAVHVQSVRQDKNAGEIIPLERPADRLAADPGIGRLPKGGMGEAHGRRGETDRHRHQRVVADVVPEDLAPGAAADDAGAREHAPQLLRRFGEELASAEVENEMRLGKGAARRSPTRRLVPEQFCNLHGRARLDESRPRVGGQG